MNINPLVSVIIPFLNAMRFIREAIESVFAQTYENWELLLVDDGSSDRSTEIALGYAEQYPEKVRYLEHDGHQNRGVCASRNLGIRHAKGEYIAFLDADDVWLPHKLDQQVRILGSQPEAAMIYGRSQRWYSWTGKPEDIQRDSLYELGVQFNTLVKPPTLLTLSLGRKAATPCPSDILLRRELVECIGGFEEAFLGIYQHCEDQAFLYKVYLKAPVFVASECWNRYREHPDSCSSILKKSGKGYYVWQFFLNWLEEYLSKQGVKDTEIWKALQKELWPYRHPALHYLLEYAQHPVSQMKRLLKPIARQTLPVPVRRWLLAQWEGHEYCPPVGHVRFGSLRRVEPISRRWGFDRGLPVDRFYIENFLACHVDEIQGHVLETGDDFYTNKFGGDRVTRSDVLNVAEGNPKTTIVADLTNAPQIPSDTFDCIILTQTLQLIYDVQAAIKTLYRVLKPGGTLLATFPGISQKGDYEWRKYWNWNFTTLSAQRLFQEVFPDEKVKVNAYGNVLAAIAFLHGLAAQELRQEELDYHDPDYEVLITVSVVKPAQRIDRSTLRFKQYTLV